MKLKEAEMCTGHIVTVWNYWTDLFHSPLLKSNLDSKFNIVLQFLHDMRAKVWLVIVINVGTFFSQMSFWENTNFVHILTMNMYVSRPFLHQKQLKQGICHTEGPWTARPWAARTLSNAFFNLVQNFLSCVVFSLYPWATRIYAKVWKKMMSYSFRLLL